MIFELENDNLVIKYQCDKEKKLLAAIAEYFQPIEFISNTWG